MPSKKERAKREKRREKRQGNNSKQQAQQPDEISDNVLSAHATIAALMERSEADATVSGPTAYIDSQSWLTRFTGPSAVLDRQVFALRALTDRRGASKMVLDNSMRQKSGRASCHACSRD